MSGPNSLLEAMIAEMFGDVRLLNEEVERLKSLLPEQLRQIQAAASATDKNFEASDRRIEEAARVGRHLQAAADALAGQMKMLEGTERRLSDRVNQLSAVQREIKETAGRMPGRLWLAAAALATATAGAGLALGGQWVQAWVRQQWGFL